MEARELKVLLGAANLSKKEFAQMIGISQQSVNNWGVSKAVPYWVEGYLKNYIELKKYEAIRDKIIESGILEMPKNAAANAIAAKNDGEGV